MMDAKIPSQLFLSDIENVMRYFNINQVEKKDTMKKYTCEEEKIRWEKDTTEMIRTREKKDARIKNGTH